MAAFRGMHVSPAKHSYAWLPRKCDYRTDRQTDGRTDRRRTKWSLCAAMLRRRRNKLVTEFIYNVKQIGKYTSTSKHLIVLPCQRDCKPVKSQDFVRNLFNPYFMYSSQVFPYIMENQGVNCFYCIKLSGNMWKMCEFQQNNVA